MNKAIELIANVHSVRVLWVIFAPFSRTALLVIDHSY
jgi:hypothetical protein